MVVPKNLMVLHPYVTLKGMDGSLYTFIVNPLGIADHSLSSW